MKKIKTLLTMLLCAVMVFGMSFCVTNVPVNAQVIEEDKPVEPKKIFIKEIKILYQNQQSYWLIDNPILTISNRNFIPANKIIEKLMQEQMLEAFSFIYARYNDDYYCNNYFVTGIFETSIDIYLYTQVDPLTIDFSLNIISEDNNFFIQKESHWWDSIVNFFKNIIQKIKSLFSR